MADKNSKPAKNHAGISRAGIGFGVLVQSLCVLFLVIAANYVGFNYFERWDFSRSQRFTLSDQTKQALKQFQPALKMAVYFSPTNLGLESTLYGDVQSLLAELQFSARKKLEVEWVDPVRDVTRARELQEKYKFDGTQSVVVLDYNGRVKIVPVLDLGDYDLSGVANGEPPQLRAFIGEATLTSAFIELLNPDRARVYFLQGHDEAKREDLNQICDAITRQNAEVWGLNLAASNGVPKDADAICIIGPKFDLSDAERAMLESYWRKKGRLIILLDPARMFGAPNLRKLINAACIYPRNDRVLRILQNRLNPGLVGVDKDVVGVFLPDSVITKRLAGVNALFAGGTMSLLLDVAGAPRADIQLRPLVQATEEYWGESRYMDVATNGVRFDQGEDTPQPLIVAAYAEKGGSSDDRTDVATSRMVVVGNSGFIEDKALAAGGQGNLDFMVSAVNRMLERKSLLGVSPRVVTNYMLNLTEPQLRGIALYALFVLPGIAVLLGILVGLRRRA